VLSTRVSPPRSPPQPAKWHLARRAVVGAA